MRHGVDHRSLSRNSAHRKAMLRNQVISLIQHERIQTTLPKAKELRRVAEKMVTLGKKDTLASRRKAAEWVHDPEALKKLFSKLAPRFSTRPGGYTRILKSGFRNGDQAPLAFIEYLQDDVAPKSPKTLKTKKVTPAKKASKKSPKK